MGEAMERFVRRENVKHYKELLKNASDPKERERIRLLLAEEEQKQIDAGDPVEERSTTNVTRPAVIS